MENPAIDSEPMDFTDCGVATPEPDGDWELVITHGGLAAGLSSEMPSYGDALTGGQIEALIGYIRGFCAEPGWPIGTLNFPRPIFTEKAFPENEFLVLPEFSDGVTEFGLRAIYERRLGRRGHVEVLFPFESVSAAGERRCGSARPSTSTSAALTCTPMRAGLIPTRMPEEPPEYGHPQPARPGCDRPVSSHGTTQRSGPRVAPAGGTRRAPEEGRVDPVASTG